MSLENKVKDVFVQVLNIKPDEIKPDAKLYDSLGVDSTELVEVCVALKKTFAVDLAGNEIKKNNSINDIVNILKNKGVKE